MLHGLPGGKKNRKQTNEQNGQSSAAERLMCTLVSVSASVAGELLALCWEAARVSVQTVCDRHSLKKRQFKHTFCLRLNAHPGRRTNALGPTRHITRFAFSIFLLRSEGGEITCIMPSQSVHLLFESLERARRASTNALPHSRQN